jgi:hypothetical protein
MEPRHSHFVQRNTLLHKSLDMHYVKHKLVKSTLPSHHVKHDDTQVPPNCRRAEKQAGNRHPGWLDLSLKRVLSVELVELKAHKLPGNCLNYTRHSERHAWALLKRSYQATYFSVFHITVFLGAFWRGIGGVGAVFNARGLICGCVIRARKFTPLARVIFGRQASKNAHDAGLDKHCTL